MDDLTDTRHINRLEIVDTGRRRRWSAAEKLRIVEESFSGPRLASATARRHGISNQLLFAWRKAYREGQLGDIRGSGTRILDLTSRASREPANRLYQKLGFKLRDTLVYREPRDCTDRAGGDLKLRAARPSATGSRDRSHPNGNSDGSRQQNHIRQKRQSKTIIPPKSGARFPADSSHIRAQGKTPPEVQQAIVAWPRTTSGSERCT